MQILSVMFVKSFPLPQNMIPQLSRKSSSEMLCSAMYNNNGESSDKCDCQFLKCIFMHIYV